ncbi:hypothetical protein A2223_01480 [Candidatus Falkowbacteria bacterium RIFOXYA2_FULL_35_8]|uniref:Uncharacterized protein n=1 Tax=Candidatus Falkowbacteria bacterium RIFOXYC2_FULL_36_12 TaxID=1798002 RepID=A0A1F5T3P8_9BACT|nr:MAG: hypothetical protein A2478_02440 [Candidatus Falkowbacteria bacterium RIFOXYC2_FULL_36_12]OGF33721.1 MAG: hypothetical protein A2223_01480 [Candidatus Falkowbacteria bacterium RIFOXYA2_FULL_35_8]
MRQTRKDLENEIRILNERVKELEVEKECLREKVMLLEKELEPVRKHQEWAEGVRSKADARKFVR